MERDAMTAGPAAGARWRLPGSAALRAWLAVAACTALILWLSSDAFSASSTSRLLGPLLDFLLPDLDAQTLASLHTALRKSAHVAEYALLGALSFRALRLSVDTNPLRTAGLALALVLAVASADEARQARSESRTGSAFDVALDGSGGLAAVGLAVAHRRWRRGRRQAASESAQS